MTQNKQATPCRWAVPGRARLRRPASSVAAREFINRGVCVADDSGLCASANRRPGDTAPSAPLPAPSPGRHCAVSPPDARML